MKHFLYVIAVLAVIFAVFNSAGCATTPTSSQEATFNIVDSRWSLVFHNPKFGKKEIDIVFYEKGKLGYLSPNNTTPDNDFWEQQDRKIILKINNAFAVYEGEIVDDNTLSGTAKSKTGGTWNWKATRKP